MSTTPAQQTDADQALALARVRTIKSFYMHLAHYVFVVAFLALVNLFTSPSDPWVLWVALAWGLGIALTGLRVFGKVALLNDDWEKRQVERYSRTK